MEENLLQFIETLIILSPMIAASMYILLVEIEDFYDVVKNKEPNKVAIKLRRRKLIGTMFMLFLLFIPVCCVSYHGLGDQTLLQYLQVIFNIA